MAALVANVKSSSYGLGITATVEASIGAFWAGAFSLAFWATWPLQPATATPTSNKNSFFTLTALLSSFENRCAPFIVAGLSFESVSETSLNLRWRGGSAYGSAANIPRMTLTYSCREAICIGKSTVECARTEAKARKQPIPHRRVRVSKEFLRQSAQTARTMMLPKKRDQRA